MCLRRFDPQVTFTLLEVEPPVKVQTPTVDNSTHPVWESHFPFTLPAGTRAGLNRAASLQQPRAAAPQLKRPAKARGLWRSAWPRHSSCHL